jgi:hypothetical protein
MNKDEIRVVFDKALGMFPTTKLTTKTENVLDAWQSSAVLRDFPFARRADLYRRLTDNVGYFPTLPELVKLCRQLVPREQADKCQACDDTGYLHYEETGEWHQHNPAKCNVEDCVGSVKWGELLTNPIKCGYCAR